MKTLCDQVLTALPSADLLIVDDNSPDGTGQLADEMAAKNPRIQVLHRSGKLGLGTAYIAGFRFALSKGYEFYLRDGPLETSARSVCSRATGRAGRTRAWSLVPDEFPAVVPKTGDWDDS